MPQIMFDYTLRGRLCVPEGSTLNATETGIVLPDGREIKLWEQLEIQHGEDDYESLCLNEAQAMGIFYDGDCSKFEGPVEDGNRVWPPTNDARDATGSANRSLVTRDEPLVSLIDEPVTGVPIGPPVEKSVAITLQDEGQIIVIERFDSIAAAEDYLATSATIDPDLLEIGAYGIDAPEEMLNPSVRSA